MTLDEALKWADTFGPLQSDPPDGDSPALLALAHEVRRCHSVIARVNARCDHLGIRLGEIMRERDALRAAIAGEKP